MKIFSCLVVAAMIFGTVLLSCDKKYEKESTYPTTIYCLSEKSLLQKRNDFSKKNPHIKTTLDDFGFCALIGESPIDDYSSGGLTEEEGIAAIRAFVARNLEYTGISNPNNLQIKRITGNEIGNLKAFCWNFMIERQTINDIEVFHTEILFCIKNRILTLCHGKHFSDVYVPEKFNVDIENAKSQLLGKEIFHGSRQGTYSAGFVTTEHLQQCTTKLIIVPIGADEKTELHVVWQIDLGTPLEVIFEIDVMTGEIIRKMSKISHLM